MGIFFAAEIVYLNKEPIWHQMILSFLPAVDKEVELYIINYFFINHSP